LIKIANKFYLDRVLWHVMIPHEKNMVFLLMKDINKTSEYRICYYKYLLVYNSSEVIYTSTIVNFYLLAFSNELFYLYYCNISGMISLNRLEYKLKTRNKKVNKIVGIM